MASCLVVGCGSIGTRHAKILSSTGHTVDCIDVSWNRASDLARITGGSSWREWFDVPHRYSVGLVCTPPDTDRLDQIDHLLQIGVRGLFVEKPVSIHHDELALIERVMPADVVTMGACNLRFTNASEVLRDVEDVTCVMLRMRQAAKYWNPRHRPVSLVLDSIHELDLAITLQGPATSITGFSLTDYCWAVVRHEAGGLTILDMDRISDPPCREAVVSHGGGRHIFVTKVEIRGMYERQMRHFMDCVAQGDPTCNPLADAVQTCRLALEIVS